METGIKAPGFNFVTLIPVVTPCATTQGINLILLLKK